MLQHGGVPGYVFRFIVFLVEYPLFKLSLTVSLIKRLCFFGIISLNLCNAEHYVYKRGIVWS